MWYCYSEGGKCEECGRGGRGVCQMLIYSECGIAIQKVGSVKSADEEGEVCVKC